MTTPDDVSPEKRQPSRPPEELLSEYNKLGYLNLKVEDNDRELKDLRSLLQSALQLEHMTIPVYLTGLYSLRPDMPWRVAETIRTVVVEEMLHLTLVANVLNAIDGDPVLDSADFLPPYPSSLPYGVDGIKLNLLPFSPEFLAQALAIEHPKGINPVRVDIGARDVDAREAMTIGEFYMMIESKLVSLASVANTGLFVPDSGRQVKPNMFYYDAGGQPLEVTDLKSAQRALHIITDQGEGIERTIWADLPIDSEKMREVSHYARFVELRDRRLFRGDDTLDSGPHGVEIDVPMFRTYNVGTNAKLKDYPDGSEVRTRAEAFNQEYWDLLRILQRAFRGEPGLLEQSVQQMCRIRDAATRLIRNPFPGKEGRGLYAAPTFEFAPAR